MKVSRFKFPNKEKPKVKRILLVLGTAVLFLNTFVAPTIAMADGGAGGTSCNGSTNTCKP